ncbi:hypothetical protein LCGC14_0344300 [marine sediment metagenome]|uniref:Uncharacterized protein n=1 Tax=marine sediment metagenome TaxID=412755 RepID=A0A0F9TI94_9ZZZZ
MGDIINDLRDECYPEQYSGWNSLCSEAADEIERLNKMRTHCENCGGDYLATGLEVGCPCLLVKENEWLKKDRDFWAKTAKEYKDDYNRYIRTGKCADGPYITPEMINAARATRVGDGDFISASKLGIFRCERCSGCHIFTNDQVNEAWAYFEAVKAMIRPYNNLDIERIFNKLGIERCDACGGEGENYDPSGEIDDFFCNCCGGHGWVIYDQE